MLPVVFCLKSVVSILLTEMLMIKITEGFILRPDILAMIRRQVDLDRFPIIHNSIHTDINKLPNFTRQQAVCRNPSESDLNKQLSQAYSNTIEMIKNGVEFVPSERSKIETLIKDTSSSIYKSVYESGNQLCSRSEQTQWARMGGPSTCPYHFENKYRHNWFPFRQRHAVCNCLDSCLRQGNASRHHYACFPNYIVKLALERKACKPDGFYHFESAFEYVPISCSCRERTLHRFI